MAHDINRLIVLTGAPGAGKTTLIEALQRAGFARSVEAGRAIIQDQAAIGGTALPWRDPAAFADLMLSWDMRSYRMAAEHAGFVFFDRGIPDVTGYLRLSGLPVPDHVHKAAAIFRYHRRVFIAPPWPAIFKPDAERKQSLHEAERTYEAMVATYTSYGYELVRLPLVRIEQRLRFINDQLGFQS